MERWLLVWLMPWAEFLNEEVVFGEITVWDLYRQVQTRIDNPQEQKWLRELASHFRDRNGEPLRNLAIVQATILPFDSLDQDGNQKIRWAGNAIGFCHLIGSIRMFVSGETSADNLGNSERFQLMAMQIDTEGRLHYAEGGWAGITELAGQHVQFHQPPYMGQKREIVDRLLLKGLSIVNDEKQNTELWRELQVCFEWFSMAWTISPEVSNPARFIALMTAFESLARQGERERIPEMADYISSLCDWNNFPVTEEVSLRSGRRGVNKPWKFMFQFADYRNKFVHGWTLPWNRIRYRISDKDVDPRHVMSLIIYCVVARLMINEGLYDSLQLVILQHQINKIEESLGWNTPEKLKPSPHEDEETGE